MRSDWVTPWWQAACLPDKWDVCGVSVPPLSVWHTFALENIGNAYLRGGAVDQDSAASLLLFAQHDYAGGRKLLLMPYYRAKMIARMYRRLRKIPLEDIHAACGEYVEECMRSASRFNADGGKPCAVPYQWHIVAKLSEGNPAGIDAAWNMPYSTARCLYDAGAEAGGDGSVMSAASQEMEDNWEDYEPKMAEVGLS